MAELSPECANWFGSLDPEIKSKLVFLGNEKIQEIFNSISLFGYGVSPDDLYKGDLNKLHGVYNNLHYQKSTNNAPLKEYEELEKAFNVLKGIMPSSKNK